MQRILEQPKVTKKMNKIAMKVRSNEERKHVSGGFFNLL